MDLTQSDKQSVCHPPIEGGFFYNSFEYRYDVIGFVHVQNSAFNNQLGKCGLGAGSKGLCCSCSTASSWNTYLLQNA